MSSGQSSSLGGGCGALSIAAPFTSPEGSGGSLATSDRGRRQLVCSRCGAVSDAERIAGPSPLLELEIERVEGGHVRRCEFDHVSRAGGKEVLKGANEDRGSEGACEIREAAVEMSRIARPNSEGAGHNCVLPVLGRQGTK